MEHNSSSRVSPGPDGASTNLSLLLLLQTRDEALAQAEVGVLGAVLAAAALGNAAVLLVLCSRRRGGQQLSRVRLFVLHLALSDVAVALFQVLPQLLWELTFRFAGPDVLCRAVKYLQALSMFASTYVLLALTLDRYEAVCHPLRALRQPTRRPHLAAAAAWALSALLSTPQLFVFSMREVRPGSGVRDCWAHFAPAWGARAYVTWTALAIFVLPAAALATCYSLICRRVGRSLRAGGAARVSSGHRLSRAKVRTVHMTLVIVLAYVACWAPFFSVQLWAVWDPGAPGEDSSDAAFTITMLLASLSSCCNPWIYMFFSRHLLHDALRSLSCCTRLRPGLKRQVSNGSLCSRKTTILTHGHPSTTPGIPLQQGPSRDFYQPYEDVVTESSVL
ncbi:PREDICTED: vasopressin V1b receptor [Gavialis gangeticus]|uniref:vasopressin V1b receptor n=1 Tax=Gavialis gangeticus TaxID=94835 RepID=UPI00092F36E4|nr:PREDICTED: vasopressin V1b receptor [Gavialis gangeticus]